MSLISFLKGCLFHNWILSIDFIHVFHHVWRERERERERKKKNEENEKREKKKKREREERKKKRKENEKRKKKKEEEEEEEEEEEREWGEGYTGDWGVRNKKKEGGSWEGFWVIREDVGGKEENGGKKRH